MNTPVTARCTICTPPRGQIARAANAHTRKQVAERKYRIARNFMGGACGMPYRATMNPVLQITTKTAGMARTSRSWRLSVRMRLGDPLADFGQRLAQVIHHRPHGEDGGDPDQPVAPHAGVDRP